MISIKRQNSIVVINWGSEEDNVGLNPSQMIWEISCTLFCFLIWKNGVVHDYIG